MRSLIAATGILCFVSAQGYAQEQMAGKSLDLTLEQAVSMGVITNPEYGVVAASRRATDEELEQGEALFLPSVDMRADTGYEHTDNAATRTGTGDDTENKWRNLASLTLTQLLFDGWESQFEVKRQEARVRSAAHRVRETAELVGLAIVESYIEVLRQRELLNIVRDNVATHVDILTQIEDGVSAGRSTQADLEQVRARLAQSRATESATRQALRNAESRYLAEVGDMPGNLTLPVAPFDSLSETVETEVEKALSYSPTLDIFEADIEAAFAVAEQSKSEFYPALDFEMNATQGHDINGVDGRDRTASALVVMNWNLYRGGQKSANVREQIHRHQEAKEARSQAARAVQNDVRQTWAGMIAAGEQAEQYAAQAAANVQVVQAYKDQFDLSRRTLLDVLDAQNEWFVSRSSEINSKFVEMVGVYRLLALRGSLFPTLGLQYPRESQIAAEERWTYDEEMKAR
jgi:adhesin transport system outer membrane protein